MADPITNITLEFTTRMATAVTFRDRLEDLRTRTNTLLAQYAPIRVNYIATGVQAADFGDLSNRLRMVIQEFVDLPVPAEIGLPSTVYARKALISYHRNPVLTTRSQDFIRDYQVVIDAITLTYTQLTDALMGNTLNIDLEFEDLLTHVRGVNYNYVNIVNHGKCLGQLTVMKNDMCAILANNLDPAEIYNALDAINYTDINADAEQYKRVSCAVRTILRNHKHSFLQTVNFSQVPVENPLIQFLLTDNRPLSDTSVEGVVWQVGYNHNPRYFATMKYGKVHGAHRNYNMIHEFVIGMFLNLLRPYVPNFMYTWGAFTCTPPRDLGADPALAGRSVSHRYDFGNLCTGDVDQMEIIMLNENIATWGTFFDITQALTVPGNPKRIGWRYFLTIVFQVLYALGVAQSYCKFVHGDLHANNVLIKQLPVETDVTYPGVGGGLFPVRTRYVPYIIDYGLARIEYPGGSPAMTLPQRTAEAAAIGLAMDTPLTSLFHQRNIGDDLYGVGAAENHQIDGVYMPLYDAARLFETLDMPIFNDLDNTLVAGLSIPSIFGRMELFFHGNNPDVFTDPTTQNPYGIMAMNLHNSLAAPGGIATRVPPGMLP